MGVSVADRMLIGPDDGYQAETGRPVTFSALPLSSSRGARKQPASVLGTHTMHVCLCSIKQISHRLVDTLREQTLLATVSAMSLPSIYLFPTSKHNNNC
jgi:hypothetical protein